MRRHTFDFLSFIFGLGFLALGLGFLLPTSPLRVVPFTIDAVRWAWPVLVIGFGLAILRPAFRRREEPTPSGEPPVPPEALAELPPSPLE
jgi:hypothetical protein